MFDFTIAMERLIKHIVQNCEEFSTIKVDQMMVCFSQARSSAQHGVYASVHPLRFEGGSMTKLVRGRTYSMRKITKDGHDILYVVDFILPRFANLDFETKVTTVFHELYHISPSFDGDIRRFPGKNFAHGHSRKRYNEIVQVFADQYMALPGSEECLAFLRQSFQELVDTHDRVVGRSIRLPRPFRVDG